MLHEIDFGCVCYKKNSNQIFCHKKKRQKKIKKFQAYIECFGVILASVQINVVQLPFCWFLSTFFCFFFISYASPRRILIEKMVNNQWV